MTPSVPDPLARFAPEVNQLLGGLRADVWASPDSGLLALARLRIAQLLGDRAEDGHGPTGAPPVGSERVAALPLWPTSPLFGESERAWLELVEQFVIDVSGVSPAQRERVAAHVPPARLGDLVIALFVLDFGQRVEMALDRLFRVGEERADSDAIRREGAGRADPGGAESGSLFATLELAFWAIARLDSVDPVTTELVRLRSARRHNCRICQSTRSVAAIDSGADETVLDATEYYEASRLPEASKVALRLTDAIITQPTGIDPSLAGQVLAHFTPAQAVELVADVMRNSGQKIAVALAVDSPRVESGYELFTVNEQGLVEYLGDGSGPGAGPGAGPGDADGAVDAYPLPHG